MGIDKDFYETATFPLACSIVSLGIAIDSDYKTSEGKTVFVFPRSKELEELIELYWKKKLSIEPNVFWETQRFLKSKLHDK